MAASTGKSPLETLKNFTSHKWFQKDFKKFALRVATEYGSRDEIFDGCVITKGSGTTDADQMNLVVSAGNVKLNGVLSSVSAVANKEAVLGASSSLQIVVGGVPAISANSGTHEVLRITSAGVECTVRFYDSSAASPTGYDSTGNWDAQIDIDLNGLDAAAVALTIQEALTAKFPDYTVGSGTNFTITAPVGDGFDFTYAEDDGATSPTATNTITNIAGTATGYSYSFGGLINASGEAVTSALDSDANDYYITFIVSNTDGAGGVDGDDADAVLLHGILSGTESFLSTQDINQALAASSGNVGNYDHSGVTAWCHVAEILKDSTNLAGGKITMNRNNAVSQS